MAPNPVQLRSPGPDSETGGIMRDHMRGWARRAGAGLATAGLLVTGMLLAGAKPAQADCYPVPDPTGIHYQCDIDGGGSGGPGPLPGGGGGPILGGGVEQPDGPAEDGGSGGGSGGGRVALDFAVSSLVDLKLDGNTNCNSLITGLAPALGENARTVFQKVAIVRKPQDPNYPTAAASAEYHRGSLGEMWIYPKFDEYNGGDIQFFVPPNTALSRAPDRTEFKAMFVLHELAHLTGALAFHVPDNSDAQAFNLQILNKCFGITKVN